MDLSKKNQEQTAGDNSIQNQIEGQGNMTITQVNNNYGVTASDVVSIATTVYNQLIPQTVNEYSEIATATVNDRLNAFGRELFPRIDGIEGAIEAFRDPKFQFMLRDAQITAAKTDRTDDMNLLSELLACHITKGDDIKIDAGIHHAIKIVDEIDNDALCALTVACAFQFYRPTANAFSAGLDVLDGLFKNLIYLKLPFGMNWLDHLDMLGAVRLSPLHFKKVTEYLCSQYNGYVCVGIKKDSEEMEKANIILDENNISRSVLVDNECIDGYVRLGISSFDDVKPDYVDAINSIRNLYSVDKAAINLVKEKFMEIWDSHKYLRIVRNWWSQIPNAFSVSYIGRVLAQTNAKRIDPILPDLI